MQRQAVGTGSRKRGAARVTAIAPLVVALVALLAPSAFAANAVVSVVDGSFQPNVTQVKLGGTVEWDFASTNIAQHTTTDNTGLGIWDSGLKSPGQVFTFTFRVSGTFAYHCTVHLEMRATMKIKPNASPLSGTQTTQFKITWASAIPAGDSYTVQVMGPTDGGVWKPFRSGTTTLSASFIPNEGIGNYRFRARIANATVASAFSPPRGIKVTS